MASEKKSASVLEKQWAQVVARTWSDEAFKKRLLAEPAVVLKEAGLEVPAGLQIKVVENSVRLAHVILSPAPAASERSEEVMAFLQGGVNRWALSDEAFEKRLLARAWSDGAFKKRLLREPAVVLKEERQEVAEGLQVKVLENTERLAHLVLPPAPVTSELSEQALASVSGGVNRNCRLS